jgi:hypothetical protein
LYRYTSELRTLCGTAAAILRRALPTRVVLAAPAAYGGGGGGSGWTRFYHEMTRRGGVVEACPESVTVGLYKSNNV